MPSKIEALGIFLVLLPGFTCAYVAQYLAVRREQSELDKAIEALLFSSILYLITLPFFQYSLPVSWALGQDAQYHIHVNYEYFIVLFLASAILGIAYAANINHDWALSLLRKCKVTERTARSAIWHDVFQDNGGWVQVSMKDGKKALGWVRYYSDDVGDRSLFLESASWIDDMGGEEVIDGPGLFLTKDSEIESVMFLAFRTRDDAASGSEPTQ
jgi:hypothetical protein